MHPHVPYPSFASQYGAFLVNLRFLDVSGCPLLHVSPSSAQLLPSFLAFSATQFVDVPAAHMACPAVVGRTTLITVSMDIT